MLALYAATTSTTPGAKDAANSFRAADVNRDGVLTQAEFSRWFQIAERGAADTEASSPPTAKQLFHVMLRNGVPFVGFGFLDNAGMIIFGEYIDDTIGAAFRLSTMASAGLGNAVSDVLGLGFGKVIESISIRLGLPDPKVRPSRAPPPSPPPREGFGRMVSPQYRRADRATLRRHAVRLPSRWHRAGGRQSSTKNLRTARRPRGNRRHRGRSARRRYHSWGKRMVNTRAVTTGLAGSGEPFLNSRS